MKIGFIANYFYPATGGMEELAFNFAKELARRGHEVHVFTSDRKDGKIFAKEEIVEGVKFHRSRLWFNYKYYLKFNPGIAFKHLKYDLDVLHFQSIGFIFQDLALILRKIFTRTKLVDSPLGPFMALDKYPLWQEILRDIYTTLEYSVNKLYDCSIQINPYQYKWMKKYGLRNIRFIPAGIPSSTFMKIDGKKFADKYNLKNKFVIGYLGRVQEYKGLEQVVRILPELIKKNKNILFIVMGAEIDNEIERLKKIARELNVENNVVFTGMVDEKEKLMGLDAMKIFVFPSEWEAFGIVLVEAMARGCALVSTKTEGGNFLVGEGEGLLYDYKNLEELKKCLLKLIEDDKMRNKMKKNNLAKAKKYEIKSLVDKLEGIYLE